MKIKYLAHASFLITSAGGVRIITDPYESAGGIRHAPIRETADIVTVSHEHADHNHVASIRGNPAVVKQDATIKGVKIRAIPVAHDEKGGGQRGKNTIFCLEVDGIRLCHCGDLGHILTEAQVKAIGAVDILMVPVGGFYTIDAGIASRVCDQLNPRIVLPMHYKTEKVDYPITGVEEFLKGKTGVVRAEGSELDISADKLPRTRQIIVLRQSL
ncbi:MAG: MBL fold metallo-hydrolase [Dehalococcoidales bacterium]|nr:MBL fold metallo-hydrolase [Dehalococcoidales bacterium]